MKKSLIVLILLLWAGTALAHGISESDRQDMVDGGMLTYIELGASHMLTGYDHLLFLLGVVFYLTRFRDVVKFITAFTVGHSITLIFATFMGISANYFLVDAVIALTVAYKGFDNLGGFQKVFRIESPNLVMLVFVFGLIHGFGLSTRLQQLPLGEGDGGLLLRILSFNLGVELGQIAALLVMLVLLNLWRRHATFVRFSRAVNVGLVLAGFGLLVFQLNGYATERGARVNELDSGPTVTEGPRGETAWEDVKVITIPPNRGLEYKLAFQVGGKLEYEWTTESGELSYDFHGEAYDAAPDEFTSFERGSGSHASGAQIIPFTGKAGWWWKNNGTEPVVVRLSTRGQYEVVQ